MRIIIIQVWCLFLSSCHLASSQPHGQQTPYPAEVLQSKPAAYSHNPSIAYGSPIRLADLKDPSIIESSGIIASRGNPDLFWTHNDSGDGPFIYAFDRNGSKGGVWRVTAAQARDWEDIAIGPGSQPGQSYLYIGDIGDNESKRSYITIYRVVEPMIVSADAASTKSNPRLTETAEAIRLRYPDGKHDAEALMVHPTTGDLYIVTKTSASFSGIYKLAAPLSTSTINTLVRVGKIHIPSAFGGLITGGDISPDGRRVILCDYLNAYEMRLPEDSPAIFDQIWEQPLTVIELGPRQQGEAVCYRADGQSLFATSENRPTPLIEVKRSR